MNGKELIKKIKELGVEKEIVFSEDYMIKTIDNVEVKDEKIILK